MEAQQAQAVAQKEARDLTFLQALSVAVKEAHVQYLRDKIRQYPQHTNRASSIGHGCERYLYYSRVNWADRNPHSPDLQGIFDIGNKIEEVLVDEIIAICRKIGVVGTEKIFFAGQQTSFHDKTANISGHIDGAIVVGERSFPVEFKSVNQNKFPSLKTVEDLRTDSRWYVRGYYDQMQSYLYLFNQPLGLIIFKCKGTGAINVIPVELDFAYYESVLQKAERVNRAVEAGTPPERNIDFDICPECAFKKICFEGKDLQLPAMDNDRLLDALERKRENEEAHKAYEKAAEIVKEECARATCDTFTVGNWVVKRTLIEEKEMPATIRKAHYRSTAKPKGDLK